MDYIIGAALLATGVFISRIFETFWPSKEAERQRDADKRREEREARRRYRAELVKPLVEVLDGIGLRDKKRWVTEWYRRLPTEHPELTKESLSKVGLTVEELENHYTEKLQRLTSENFQLAYEEELPLVSRVGSEELRKRLTEVLLLSIVIPGWLDDQRNENKIAEAHMGLEEWVSSTESD